MALDDDLMFIAQNKDLEAYNGKPILNIALSFQNSDLTAFTFPGFISAYMNIYQSRSESLLKNFVSQIYRSGSVLLLNISANDMTFNDVGKYYFEIGYIQSGGYSIPLRFGNLNVI